MRILIIEDDKDLAQLTKLALEKENFTVDICLDGAEGLYYMQENMYDLVLLDRMLPSMDGLQVLTQMRLKGIMTPVLLMTALGSIEQRVEGLDCGADDYLVKPFAMDLLTAKVQAVLRRVNAVQEKSLEKFGCELNLLTNDLDFQGESVRLTPTEGLIMKLLMLNANQTVSKKKLISALWQGNNFIDENALNVNLSRLRGKLSTLEGPLQITTVRGQGYRLEEKL